LNTVMLILSSVSLEVVRQQIARRVALMPVGAIRGVSIGEERMTPWLGVAVALGVGFLAGQLLAWRELERFGFYLATTPSSSFVYLLTATHAVHLAAGLIALLCAVAMFLKRRPTESRYIVIDTVAWYWHFMAVLWVYIFALLWFAK
jgi:cytochrome c oxidase subunit III